MSSETYEVELPFVAHIVADLDAIEAEEASPAAYLARYTSAPRHVARRKPSRLQTWFRSAAVAGF
jgi:hypothetical protein